MRSQGTIRQSSKWAAAGAVWLGLALTHAVAVETDDSESSRTRQPRSRLTEHVEVTATRLPADEESVERLPAHVTVIDRRRIERSGAMTIQDLLGLEAGAVLYDEVGNDVEKRLDLRGFTEGTATKVFLDGAPINDTRNNQLPLHLLPLHSLERIEIVRGAAANAAGGGSEAGIVNLRSLVPAGLGGSLSVAAGSDDTTRWLGAIRDRMGRADFSLSGLRDTSDGFRENSGGDLRRLTGGVGVDLAGAGRVELSLLDAASRLGAPGALTAEELETDRRAAPFNRLDFSKQRLAQAAVNYRGAIEGFGISANLFARDRRSQILSTGRAAATFGGFFLESDARALGSTLQVDRRLGGGGASHTLSAGLEWLDGETESLGFFTAPQDPGSVDRQDPSTRNVTDRRTVALYVQDAWRLGESWSVHAAARLDRDRVGYADRFDPALDDSRTFSELSLRAGASWHPDAGQAIYAAYGEAFLPPTVEQLFAFPGFGSNADLRPQDSRTFEVGWRCRWAESLALDLALLNVDTRDEIEFVPGVPPDFGRNENVGRTRRRGAELSLRGRLAPRVRGFANLTWLQAEFRTGPERGNEVPLVPRERVSAGLEAELPRGFGLRGDVTYVGRQVLDNDRANTQAELEDYAVVNARASWAPSTNAHLAGGRLLLFVEARNLFDREYATRGIYAFDFAAGDNAAFFTPAPDRRLLAGAEWRF